MIVATPQPPFIVDHVEAPQDIGLGTMAVNVWVRVGAAHEGSTIGGVAIKVLGASPGEEEMRIEMRPLDGRFDSVIETAIATIDTYKWVKAGPRNIEILAHEPGAQDEVIAKHSIRVKPRLEASDLLLLDSVGRAHSWIGTGAGGFTAGETFLAGVPSGRPRTIDWNGDQRLDLVVSAERGEISVIENLGAGRFEILEKTACNSPALDAAPGDFNSDGKPDLVGITEENALEIHITGNERGGQISSLNADAELLEVADLDNDGYPEIYVSLTGTSGSEVQVWTRERSNEWSPSLRLPAPPGGRGKIVALLAHQDQRTRRARLLIASASAAQGLLESWGVGADTESRLGIVCLGATRFAGPLASLAIGKLSGKDDAILAAIRRESGAALFAIGEDGIPRSSGQLPQAPRAMALVDLDADGDDDLVTAGEDLRLWINVRGESFFEAGESPYRIGAPVVALFAEDLDERKP
jgi:hypothetical protein